MNKLIFLTGLLAALLFIGTAHGRPYNEQEQQLNQALIQDSDALMDTFDEEGNEMADLQMILTEGALKALYPGILPGNKIALFSSSKYFKVLGLLVCEGVEGSTPSVPVHSALLKGVHLVFPCTLLC